MEKGEWRTEVVKQKGRKRDARKEWRKAEESKNGERRKDKELKEKARKMHS